MIGDLENMLKIEHLAIWCKDLEKMKTFYCNTFQATSNDKYTNQSTGFSSYFLTFPSGGPRLELMYRTDIQKRLGKIETQYLGIAHFAISVESKALVDQYIPILTSNGATIIRGPRITGDGYYEIEALDIENNRIEIISR
jgi:lactoylglutathione lyase